MYLFYDLLTDVMLVGILAALFMVVWVVVLIIEEAPELLSSGFRKVAGISTRMFTSQGGAGLKPLAMRVTGMVQRKWTLP